MSGAEELCSWLLESARRAGSAPALIQDSRVTSYAELARDAQLWARRLTGPGRVAVVGPSDEWAARFHWGALLAGRTLAHINPEAGENTELRLAAIQPSCVFRWGEGLGEPVEGTAWRWWRQEATDGSGPAIVVQSGGCTGRVRPIGLGAASLAWSARALVEWFDLGPGERLLGLLPFHYTLGLSSIHLAALLAGPLVMSEHASPSSLVSAWREHQVGFLPLVPYHCHMMLRDPRFHSAGMPGVRRLWIGNGPLATSALEELNRRFLLRVSLFYGVAEAMGRITSTRPGIEASSPEERGFPLPGVELRVAADGEVLARGPNLMQGYLDEPSAEVLGEGWLSTGDRARLDPARGLVLVGRRKRIAECMGEPLSLDALEDVLRELPAVSEARAAAVSDPVQGEALQVRLRITAPLGQEAVRLHCRRRLGRAYVPRSISFEAETGSAMATST